ncbi:EKC/KEOPS complex, subunit Gon7 [Paramyrothecium foliicola]|nr:EKC/KEOPS complex, subunit Gon7 [Paramyrothecium foliicola]
MTQSTDRKLTVNYTSPTNESFNVAHSIPAPSSETVQDKTQYLVTLRNAVTATQDEVNKELTKRMEEDKARDASSKPGIAKNIDEDKEEENYGEEVQEED